MATLGGVPRCGHLLSCFGGGGSSSPAASLVRLLALSPRAGVAISSFYGLSEESASSFCGPLSDR